MTKIMLVEDDNNLREIYEARLVAEGYSIVSAQDGEAALALAAKERPDLIITDVMMPKISGFEMLDILRNTENLRDVKVIMLTALGQAEDNARAGELGADRYLVKSQVTLEDIIKATHDVLDPDEIETPVVLTPEPTAMPAADTPQSVSSAPVQTTDDTAVNNTMEPEQAVQAPVAAQSEPPVAEPDPPTDQPDTAVVPDSESALEPAPIDVVEPTAEPATETPQLDLPDVPVDPIEVVEPAEPINQTGTSTLDNSDAPDTADNTDAQVSDDSQTPSEDTGVDTEDTSGDTQQGSEDHTPDTTTDTEFGSPSGTMDSENAEDDVPATNSPDAPDTANGYDQGATESNAQSAVADEAAPAQHEEHTMRQQIDQFLDAQPAVQETPLNSTDAAPQEPTEPTDNLDSSGSNDSSDGQEPVQVETLPEESDEEYDKDKSTPDFGQLSVHEQSLALPENPVADQPASVPEPTDPNTPTAAQEQQVPVEPAPQQATAELMPAPAPAVQDAPPTAPVTATPGYPSQPYQLSPMPGANVAEPTPAPAPAYEPTATPVQPPAEPAAPVQSSGDKVVADAIDQMIASTPSAVSSGLPTPPLGADPDAGSGAPQQTPGVAAYAQNEDVAVRKRVISPLGTDTAKPDINQLLAIEDAKTAATQAGNTMQAPGAYPQGVPPAPPQPNADQPWQPIPVIQPPRQSKYGPGTDPNSISL